MKVGILTFHWATNYGAVLQTYALQEYLTSLGHKVVIIHYKPKHFDFYRKMLLQPWNLFKFKKNITEYKKEKLLQSFRLRYLNTTEERYVSSSELLSANLDYDIVVSGSDQILNPSYTLYGENKQPTSTYYLTFAQKAKRVGYAVSFGCVSYPEDAKTWASKWINSFDVVGVREDSGLIILKELGYKGSAMVVPDPTVLFGPELLSKIGCVGKTKKDHYCTYVLRRSMVVDLPNVIHVDDTNNPLSLEEWVNTIVTSKGLITNSYHGMIVAILSRVPFVVILEKLAHGMNDRFSTLLKRLNLMDRICVDESEVGSKIMLPINWEHVDKLMSEFQDDGIRFWLSK